MTLIIGGAYQGKGQYALEHYGGSGIVNDFHLIVLEQLRNDLDPVKLLQEGMHDLGNKVIICEDISCGVVPTDPLMRRWRECVGHCLALLAHESDEVVRVFCGIGTRLR